MARIRVYLITYRRNELLKRAIQSLLDQTFTDWICEVHNDDPRDENVAHIVESFGDSRFCVMNHEVNYGPIKTYNLAYREVEEEFVSMLHDDNWWEPDFLKTMIEAMDERPEVRLATANQQIWQEERDGTWTDTGRTVRRLADRPMLIYWPHKCQIMGPFHTDGAALMRSKGIERWLVPECVDFGALECVRERAIPFPIMYVGRPIANFAVTLATSRSNDIVDFGVAQVLAAGSFFRSFFPSVETMREFMREERARPLKRINTLVIAGLFYPGCRKLLKYLSASDWLYFLASCVKRFGSMSKIILRVRKGGPLRDFVNEKTADRAREARRNGIDDLVDA